MRLCISFMFTYSWNIFGVWFCPLIVRLEDLYNAYWKVMETVQLLVKFEVFTVLLLKIRVFWNVTMCSRIGGCHRSCTASPGSWRSSDPGNHSSDDSVAPEKTWIPMHNCWQNMWYLCFAFRNVYGCDTVRCIGTALVGGKVKSQIFTKKFNVAFFWGEDVTVGNWWVEILLNGREIRIWGTGHSVIHIMQHYLTWHRKKHKKTRSPYWPWYKRPFLAQSLASLISFMLT
jgi:hypothetical protein